MTNQDRTAKKRVEWISVKDRLPEPETEVRCKFENGQVNEKVMFWSEEEGFDGYAEPLHVMVTHWMPRRDSPNT